MISKTLISDLRSTSKVSEKIDILKRNDCEFLRYLLKATYEPFDVYHIRLSANDIPLPGKLTVIDTVDTFYKVIESCRRSNSNVQNKEIVIPFLRTIDKDAQDLLIGVLIKNWKAGISVKTVNKAFPELVSQFKVQLSNSYIKSSKKKNFKRKSRYCSFKLDGVRCVFIRDVNWKAYSRQGKEFLTVDHIKKDLERLYLENGMSFWDGELYIPNKPFEDIQGKVMSFTKGTSKDLEYHTFICGKKKDFFMGKTGSFKIVEHGYGKVVPVKQVLISDKEVESRLEDAFSLGYEGIMLRDPDKLYDFKRSDALLKLKESSTDKSQEQIEDCLVVDVEVDKFPVIEDGITTYRDLLVKLFVKQKDGKVCKVGTGFSLEFREYYTEHKEELIGKVVEIKFQGYGSKGLMRFPRLYRVREDLTWEE